MIPNQEKRLLPNFVGVCACACAVFTLAGCERAGRAQEFMDAHAALREQSHVHLISRDLTEAISAQVYPETLDQEARKGHPIDKDPEQLKQALHITGQLVAQAERMYPHSRGWEWDLHVIGRDEINAWCMAGGKMVMYSGLIKLVGGDPHKIAAVMGHEISHALLEHSRQSMSRDMLLSSGLWIAAKSLKVGAVRSEAIRHELHLALQPFNRQAERDADALGLELMARAGFDPVVGSQIWRDMKQKINNAGEKRLRAFMDDHPMSDERLAALTTLAQKLKNNPAAMTGGASGKTEGAAP